jgi:hypothetical protein
MERDYGSAEDWQMLITREWLVRLAALPSDVSLAVLDGQTRPSFVFEAAAVVTPSAVHVALLDCSSQVRNSRLRTSRKQSAPPDVKMDHWATYLRNEADALNLMVIDTTSMTITQAADDLEAYALRLIHG